MWRKASKIRVLAHRRTYANTLKTKPGGLANLIMPHRREKIKEETMTLQEQLLDLDAAVNQISSGINAIAAMSRGLDRVDDPYADGFYFLADHLIEAVQNLRKQTDRCLSAM